MKTRVLLAAGIMGALSGCSTMNEHFTCNQTAGDSCLTIDAVNAMTEPKGTFTKRQIINHHELTDAGSPESSHLWIAAWQDERGRQHKEQTVALIDRNKGSA